MNVQLDIPFNQIIKVIKDLPLGKLKQLKVEIEKQVDNKDLFKIDELESLLLNGPTATKKELEIIENNRKQINKWQIH